MERKYSIDLLRIICAIAVIVIHVCSAPVAYSSHVLDLKTQDTLYFIQLLVTWCIPVFFMITGYCILGKKEYDYKRCFSHVFKYIMVLLTVGLFYALLEQVFVVRTVNFTVIYNSVTNVIAGKSWTHMWYVYAIIGTYLVLPVLHNFMKTGKENRIILTSLLFLFNIVLPFVDSWFKVGITFPFGGYLFFVCLGGMIAYGDFKGKWKYYSLALSALAFLGLLLDIDDYFGYLKLPTSFIAFAIFVCIVDIKIKPSKLLLAVSGCTWGIYLLHPLFINIAVKVLRLDFFALNPIVSLSIFGVVVFILSFGSTYVLKKIPIINKLF